MRERTFIASMIGLDVMLILAGGAMAWSHMVPVRGADATTGALVQGLIVMVLIAGIGSYTLYELNGAVFRLAESPSSARNARVIAYAFAVVALLGGIAGLSMV